MDDDDPFWEAWLESIATLLMDVASYDDYFIDT